MEISVIVSSYQRPEHLRRCLISLEFQKNMEGRYEVIVTDDGSQDTTLDMLKQLAPSLSYPVKVTTHEHRGFQLSRCRNEGIALSEAPYILITDGDCILPNEHLYRHWTFRKQGYFVSGDCYRLNSPASESITEEWIRIGNFTEWVEPRERKRIRNKALRARVYSWLHLEQLPRLTGCNIGVWKEDLIAVNGFDENFIGWGYEDRDLQRRLYSSGRHCRSILHLTTAFHLWHPPAPSFTPKGLGTANREYFQTFPFETRCQQGLAQRKQTVRNWLELTSAQPTAENAPKILNIADYRTPSKLESTKQRRAA